MKTIELNTTTKLTCIVFVDKITSITDAKEYRIVNLGSDKLIVIESVSDILKAI